MLSVGPQGCAIVLSMAPPSPLAPGGCRPQAAVATSRQSKAMCHVTAEGAEEKTKQGSFSVTCLSVWPFQQSQALEEM